MTYGTLGPGKPNHHQLDGLDGRWPKGHVNRLLVDAGWGASLGYLALVLQADGPAIDVEVFESADLPDHWARLDDFPRSSGQSISRGACSTRYCQEPSGWCRVGDHEGESS